MHVGLNLVFLTPGEQGGMETYARELIAALASRGNARVTCFVNQVAAEQGGPWAEVAEPVVVPVDARSRPKWVWGEQWHVPRLARRAGVDLVHSLASTGPVTGGPVRVTTVHDLNYKMVPDAHFGLNSVGMRVLVPAAARRSHRVIVDAASTRDDLVEHLGLPRDRVDVAPLAAGRAAPAQPTPEAELRARLDLGEGLVALSPSAKRPHKNLPRLLDALGAIAPERRPMLVVPGYRTPHEEELREQATRLGVADRVRFPEWVSDADMEGLYGIARCVVFPSLYEGFGLPVLEAMRRGVPVACSNRSSLPEVAGNAALLFDPADPEAIRAAFERVLDDTELRDRLAALGPEQAARFSWEATAAATEESYRRALAGRS